jgi:TRAP-type C4-dicarboxylate transport system permease large subunit
MQSIGVDVLHFGAIMIVGLAIGLVTPPLGMCLNACTKFVDISIMDIFKGSLPFLLCDCYRAAGRYLLPGDLDVAADAPAWMTPNFCFSW